MKKIITSFAVLLMTQGVYASGDVPLFSNYKGKITLKKKEENQKNEEDEKDLNLNKNKNIIDLKNKKEDNEKDKEKKEIERKKKIFKFFEGTEVIPNDKVVELYNVVTGSDVKGIDDVNFVKLFEEAANQSVKNPEYSVVINLFGGDNNNPRYKEKKQRLLNKNVGDALKQIYEIKNLNKELKEKVGKILGKK